VRFASFGTPSCAHQTGNLCLGRYHAEVLGIVLRNTPSLQTLALRDSTLGTAEMVEDAPALYHNTSIEVQY
jgi:hypothetical protein